MGAPSRSLRLEKLHRSLHLLSRSGEYSCGELNEEIGSKGQQYQCDMDFFMVTSHWPHSISM